METKCKHELEWQWSPHRHINNFLSRCLQKQYFLSRPSNGEKNAKQLFCANQSWSSEDPRKLFTFLYSMQCSLKSDFWPSNGECCRGMINDDFIVIRRKLHHATFIGWMINSLLRITGISAGAEELTFPFLTTSQIPAEVKDQSRLIETYKSPKINSLPLDLRHWVWNHSRYDLGLCNRLQHFKKRRFMSVGWSNYKNKFPINVSCDITADTTRTWFASISFAISNAAINSVALCNRSHAENIEAHR